MYSSWLIYLTFTISSFFQHGKAYNSSPWGNHGAHLRAHQSRNDALALLRRQACSGNRIPCGNGCIPSGAVCCPDGRYCDAGEFCWTADFCCKPGDVACGQGCMPPGSVCCSNDGYYCESNHVCFVTAAGSRPKCCPAGGTCTMSQASPLYQ